jgi:hypothetical protein
MMKVLASTFVLCGAIIALSSPVNLEWLSNSRRQGTPAPVNSSDCNNNDIDDTVETEVKFAEVFISEELFFAELADIDGDGDLDLIEGHPLNWRENDGFGNFGLPQTVDASSGFFGTGDMDGDGDTDLVLQDSSGCGGRIKLYENLDGAGTFAPATTIYEMGMGMDFCWSFTTALTVADRDTDGDLDILGERTEIWTELFYLENEGPGGAWPYRIIWLSGNNGYLQDIAVSDIDGDSHNDLVFSFDAWGNGDDLLWWQWGGSQHTISTGVSSHSRILVEDLDGDNDPDIVAGLPDTDEIAWYKNTDGAGTYGPRQVIAALGNFQLGDLDGDGDMDVLWDPSDSNFIAWHDNTDGTGNFGPPQTIAEGGELTAPAALKVGDINLDGETDFFAYWYGVPCDCCSVSAGTGCNCLECEVLVCSNDPSCCNVEWDTVCNGIAQSVCGCCGGQSPGYCSGVQRSVWFRNDTGDCNGNRIPDECEPDCNANGIVDACDIRNGVDVDCNGNGIPDGCDTPCTVSCDTDGDGCVDDVDDRPLDRTVCGDVDGDGCDDCSSETFDPANDGTDSDHDGICDLGDCDPTNNEIWGVPGAASDLVVSQEGTATLLEWEPPAIKGGIAVRYDTLRSTTPWNFLFPGITVCVDSDSTDPEAIDETAAGTGEVFYYLVRVENDCPGGHSMGVDSNGDPRTGLICD